MSDDFKTWGFWIIIAAAGLVAVSAVGTRLDESTYRTVVYPISDTEWGYSITYGKGSSTTFVHSERGFADEKTATDAATAYIAANINPTVPAGA